MPFRLVFLSMTFDVAYSPRHKLLIKSNKSRVKMINFIIFFMLSFLAYNFLRNFVYILSSSFLLVLYRLFLYLLYVVFAKLTFFLYGVYFCTVREEIYRY
jgi:hypothetical protein